MSPRLHPFVFFLVDTRSTNKNPQIFELRRDPRAFVPILHRTQNWSPSESSRLFLCWKNTTMSDPTAAGCSEMVSDDTAMDRESMMIDSVIRNREWDPSLRILPISPTDGSGLLGTRVLLRQRGILTRNNDTVKLNSFTLWFAVCLKGCLPSPQWKAMVSWFVVS
jgi:hypothetical protein